MQKNIVILGAGFGGLRCALEMDRAFARDSSLRLHSAPNDKASWKVILVDRNPYHIYYPRLYDTAIPDDIRPTEEMAKSKIDIREILKGTAIEFVQGEVKGIDCKGKTVEIVMLSGGGGISRKGMEYDYLVLALGAGTDYFGIAGLEKYAYTLQSLQDAEKIRARVEEFLKGSMAKLDIVIGGAGPTGVEVAAELAHLFRNVPRDRWAITIVEALQRVLSMFPNELSQYAHKKLERLGVHLMLDTCIKEVKPAQISVSQKFQSGKVEVILAPRPLKPGESDEQLMCEFLPEKEKRIGTDVLFWAGGVRANPLISQCGLPTDPKGRMELDEHLRVKGMENIFAIGDNALLVDPQTKQPVPAIAQAALLEGKIVASNIARAGQGVPLALYPFTKFPMIVPLADRDAVAFIGSQVIRGFPAWVLRKAADCRYYATVIGWRRAIGLCFFQ